jgi:hypothetical protein
MIPVDLKSFIDYSNAFLSLPRSCLETNRFTINCKFLTLPFVVVSSLLEGHEDFDLLFFSFKNKIKLKLHRNARMNDSIGHYYVKTGFYWTISIPYNNIFIMFFKSSTMIIDQPQFSFTRVKHAQSTKKKLLEPTCISRSFFILF